MWSSKTESFYPGIPVHSMMFGFETDGSKESLENVADEMVRTLGEYGFHFDLPTGKKLPKAKRVMFNAPATIVFWEDGTKTVSKARGGDVFNPLYGLIACTVRKITRNRGRGVDDFEDSIQLLSEKESIEELRQEAANMRTIADAADAAADAIESCVDDDVFGYWQREEADGGSDDDVNILKEFLKELGLYED